MSGYKFKKSVNWYCTGVLISP